MCACIGWKCGVYVGVGMVNNVGGIVVEDAAALAWCISLSWRKEAISCSYIARRC